MHINQSPPGFTPLNTFPNNTKAHLPTESFVSSSQPKVMHEVSVQKCGTHLLENVLKLFEINIGSNLHHFCCKAGQEPKTWLCKNDNLPIGKYINPNHKYFALVRDPRDALLSYIRHMGSAGVLNAVPAMRAFTALPLSQQIDIALGNREGKNSKFGFPGIQFKEFDRAIELKNANFNNVLLLRFEDLVRTNAGGSPPPIRFKVFKSISRFANLNPSNGKIHQVMKECWGNSATFDPKRPKKVGEWERAFKPHQIAIFKEKYNHLLLGLGYETDPNWDEKYLPETCQLDETSA